MMEMPEIKWTASQNEAVKSKVANILVTAAAGSGKTQVLSGRILNRIIEDKIDIDKILVVTFTKAAASEMRERIAKAISKELAKDPKNSHLRRQMSLIGSASITTMHSFCLDVVRENFFALNLSPNFRILDEPENTLLKLRAVEEVLEELYQEKDEIFLALSDFYGSAKNDEAVINMVLTLYEFSQGFINPDGKLDEFLENFKVNHENFNQNQCVLYLLKKVEDEIDYAINLLKKAQTISQGDFFLVEKGYLEMFENDISGLEELKENTKDYDSCKSALGKFQFSKKITIRNHESRERDVADSLRQKARNIIRGVKEILPYTKDEAIRIMGEEERILSVLVNATKRFRKRLDLIKREKNALDFDDLEHFALKLLAKEEGGKIVPSDIAAGLAKKYDEIYIDEYQDSNLIQESIFDLISRRWTGNPNVFMVGDVKQSIYGFRGSDISLILEKKKSYKINDEKYKKIVLSENFRCRRQIVDGVNEVFSKLFTSKTGIDYSDEEKLIFGAPDYDFECPQHKNDIILIGSQGDDGEKYLPVEKEARCIANYIRNLMGDENFFVFDKAQGKKRRLKYKDIAILSRSVSRYAQVFESVFEEYGIPSYSDINTGYFDSTEIRLMISLLEIIDNPVSDIPLLAVMRSPLFGFSENELLLIRQNHGGNFYSAVLEYSKKEGGLGAKCKKFLDKIDEYRAISRHQNVHDLIEYIYSDTNYLEYVLTQRNGHIRKANLKLLSERAAEFEKTSLMGLFNFIEYIRKTITSKGDFGSAKELSEEMDVVRIMSIHKSKGLEFPVVFVVRGSNRFNLSDIAGDLLCHRDLGLGITVVDKDRMIKYNSLNKLAIQKKIKEELILEELRLLYVALTRAREKLIFTSTVDGKFSLDEVFDDYIFSKNSFLDFMSPVFSSKCWNIIWDYEIEEAAEKDTEEEKTKEDISPGEEIVRRLSFVYPKSYLSKLPSKISVSELKRRLNLEEEGAVNLYAPAIIKTPGFLREEVKFTPAEKGSILHFFLQHMDLYDFDVEKQAKNMVEKNLLTQEEIEEIDLEKIRIFQNSSLARDMREAESVFREVPFNIEIDASILDEKAKGSKILLQGIIDCFFIKDGQITLVDYKTDYFSHVSEIVKKYARQLEFYKMAIEAKNIYKVNKKVIYLFYNNTMIEV